MRFAATLSCLSSISDRIRSVYRARVYIKYKTDEQIRQCMDACARLAISLRVESQDR